MKYAYNAIIRYLLCFIPITIYTLILTPITVYLTALILFYYKPQVSGIIITIRNINFEFIQACIASYAYWLITFLTLTVKDLELKKRIKMILVGFIMIMAMNLIRIVTLVITKLNASVNVYEIIHSIFWKFISWIYVVIVWIFLINYFKVKSIPVYDDLKYLYKKSFMKR